MNRMDEIISFFPDVKKLFDDIAAGKLVAGGEMSIHHMDGCFQHSIAQELAKNNGILFGFLDAAVHTDKAVEKLASQQPDIVVIEDADPHEVLYRTLRPYLEKSFTFIIRHFDTFYPYGRHIELLWPTKKTFASVVKPILDVTLRFMPDKQCVDALWDVTAGCPETTMNLIETHKNSVNKRKFLMAVVESIATTKKQVLGLYEIIVDQEKPLKEVGHFLRKFLEGNSWKQGTVFLNRELTSDILDNPDFAVSIGLTELLAKPITSEAHFVAFCLDLAAKVREKANA